MRFTFEGGEGGMKVISTTKDGFLVDVSYDEFANLLDHSSSYDQALGMRRYGDIDRSKFIGKTFNLAAIWTRMHDHVRLQSGLDALKMELSKMLDHCNRAKPIADEVAEIIKPKNAA